MRKSAEKEGYPLKVDIDALEKSLSEAQLNSIRQNKELVTSLIEKEISGRYYYQEGRVRTGLSRDMEIAEAINVLKTTARYNNLLGK
jgi:carboxyl-terminal processing protease